MHIATHADVFVIISGICFGRNCSTESGETIFLITFSSCHMHCMHLLVKVLPRDDNSGGGCLGLAGNLIISLTLTVNNLFPSMDRVQLTHG